MQDPEKELAHYRQQIYLDGVFLLNTRLRFLKEFGEPNNKLVWNGLLSGISSVFYQSLVDNLLVTLSWIFSDSEQEKRSLKWYLNRVKEHSKKFSSGEIDEQLERIQKVKDTVETIRKLRDKWIAHRDPMAFKDPADFKKVFQVTTDDFEVLIRLAEEIIKEHFGRFEGEDLDFGLPINGIDALVSCVNARNNLHEFVEEIEISSGRDNAEERIRVAIDALLKKQKNP